MLHCYDFYKAIKEINRVTKKNSYICVSLIEMKRKMVFYIVVTCEMFCSVKNGNGGLKLQTIKVIIIYFLNEIKIKTRAAVLFDINKPLKIIDIELPETLKKPGIN